VSSGRGGEQHVNSWGSRSPASAHAEAVKIKATACDPPSGDGEMRVGYVRIFWGFSIELYIRRYLKYTPSTKRVLYLSVCLTT
jgi:hypothetical protein